MGIPAEAIGGLPIDVSWKVTNTGSAPAVGSWEDCVYLSDDNQIGDDDRLACLPRPAELDPNVHYDRIGTIPIPVVPEGEYWIVVCADAGDTLLETEETDNCGIIGPFPVYPPMCADLVPSDVGAPDRAAAGSMMAVNWVVTNVGDGATDVPFWYDRVYLSRDQDLDEGIDTRLYPDIQNPSYLNSGEWYAQAGQVNVPGDAAGDYFVIVKTDAGNELEECDETNNIAVSPPPMVYVDPAPLPDLIVLDVDVAPNNPWSGEQITVTWTAKNDDIADVPAGAPWANAVWLSGEFEGQQVWRWLGVFWKDGPLAPGETYVASMQVVIPAQYYGPFELCIALDGHEAVDESNETNNVGCSDEFTIQQPPPADLVVSELVVPSDGWSGQAVEVAWTVRNDSENQTTQVGAWNDSVILSRDADPNTLGDNVVLGTYRHYGALGPGGQYSRTEDVNLPVDADGAYHVCVVTDVDNEVYEGEEDGEDNNARCEPINVTFAPPNLRLVACAEQPSSPSVGGELTVDWAVENIGPGDTPNAWWMDRLVLSADAEVDDSDVVLADVAHEGVLLSGDAYDATASVTLPPDVSGDPFYVIVITDSGEHVYETPESGEGDNFCVAGPFEILPPNLLLEECAVEYEGEPPESVPSGGELTVTWTVGNAGPGDALVGPWRDGVYLSTDDTWDPNDILAGSLPYDDVLAVGEGYEAAATAAIPIDLVGSVYVLTVADDQDCVIEPNDGDNVRAFGPFGVVWGPADLTVVGLVATQGSPPGEVFNVTWTVENLGGPTSPIEEWEDHVYLSADRWLDEDSDELVAVYPRDSELGYGETYSRTEPVDVPDWLYGPYYVIVKTDGGDALGESDESNNTAYADPLVAYECDSDLAVDSVDAPPTGIAGQPASVSWTVENTGASPTSAGHWNDAVYFSRDQYFDPNADTYLGYAPHDGALDPNDSYAATVDFAVPDWASGRYYVFVATDINDAVCETDELNNVDYDPNSVDVVLPPPADLVVTDIVEPNSATLGEGVTVAWTVENQGEFQAQGSWHDSVYVSADEVWDIGDKRIGKVQHTGPLDANDPNDPNAPNDGYTGSLTAPLPGVVPGDYYIIVRTDIHNEVQESDAGEQNNITASTGQMNVNCWELPLDDPNGVVGELSTGTEHYYKIVPDVPEGEDLLITLDCADDSAVTELFVRYEAVPDRVHHDFAHSDAFAADHEIVVPSAQAGRYFTLVRGANLPPGESDYTISAELLEFDIRGVSPAQAGNTSTVTMAISGAKFEEGITAELIGPDQDTIDAAIVTRVDSRLLMARFDLRNLPADTYDLVLENLGGETAAHPFVIQEGGEPALEVDISGPAVVRRGSLAVFNVAVTNSGTVDALDVLVQVGLTAGTPYQAEFDPQEPPQEWLIAEDTPNYVHINAIRPGETVDFELTVLAIQDTQIAIGATSFPLVPAAPGGRLRDDDDGGLVTSLFINTVNAMWDEWQENGWPGTRGELAEYVAEVFGSASTETVKGWLKGKIDDAVFAAAVGLIEPTPVIEALIMAGKEIYDNVKQTAEVLEALRKLTIMLKDLRTALSLDPNEKIAPAGYGEALFVRPSEDLDYTVRFENVPEASAPAQVVSVADELDPRLDWRAFRLGTIAFGDTVVNVPENRAYYRTEVDLTESHGVIVDIDAGLDLATGAVEWTLTAIDPNTGEIPENPLVGFLPPNDPNTHSGEGYVTFIMRARDDDDVPTGTEITNEATIIFDTNPPIVTNEVFNTIDSGKPSSQITALPPDWPTGEIDLQWPGGYDNEGSSGIARYSIYYRLDGGPWTLWTTTTETAGIFPARGGGLYGFYSIAIDNVGNTEDAPESPDATTTVAVQVPMAPMLGEVTAMTVTLVNLGTANVGTVEHAVFEETTGQYVGPDGYLVDPPPYWQPLDGWANTVVVGLTPSTDYSFRSRARVGGTETDFGPPAPVTTKCMGDLDEDGDTDADDLLLLLANYGVPAGASYEDGDLDSDGDVDLADLAWLLGNYGTTCP